MPPADPAPPSPSDAEVAAQANLPGGQNYYDDPDAYWRWAGQHMIQPWDPIADASPSQADQERKLYEVLKAHWVRDRQPPVTVFEAGCGRGRLAHFFTRNYEFLSYYAIDVGPLQLAEAQRLVPTGQFAESSLQSWDPHHPDLLQPWPDAYDLVVSSEVMMHIKPDEVYDAIGKLLGMVAPGGLLCLVEWVPIPNLERVPDAIHNFPHDYVDIFNRHDALVIAEKRAGLQMIYLVQPDA